MALNILKLTAIGRPTQQKAMNKNPRKTKIRFCVGFYDYSEK